MAASIRATETHTQHENEPDLKDIQQAENFLSDAQAGNDAEKRMGLLQALKLYPKASAWSILISFAVVMEGMSFGRTRCLPSPLTILMPRLRCYPHLQLLRLSSVHSSIWNIGCQWVVPDPSSLPGWARKRFDSWTIHRFNGA